MLNVASLGIIGTWATIVLCQLQLARLEARGDCSGPRSACPAPPSPAGTLAFLLAVLVLVGFDYPVGTWTVGSIAVIVPLLILGWCLCRDRIIDIADVRAGYTGRYPVIANRPQEERAGRRRGFGVTSAVRPRNATSPQPPAHRGSHMLSRPATHWRPSAQRRTIRETLHDQLADQGLPFGRS